ARAAVAGACRDDPPLLRAAASARRLSAPARADPRRCPGLRRGNRSGDRPRARDQAAERPPGRRPEGRGCARGGARRPGRARDRDQREHRCGRPSARCGPACDLATRRDRPYRPCRAVGRAARAARAPLQELAQRLARTTRLRFPAASTAKARRVRTVPRCQTLKAPRRFTVMRRARPFSTTVTRAGSLTHSSAERSERSRSTGATRSIRTGRERVTVVTASVTLTTTL